jgi:hypothetical protein
VSVTFFFTLLTIIIAINVQKKIYV